jgi:hypothetical protein
VEAFSRGAELEGMLEAVRVVRDPKTNIGKVGAGCVLGCTCTHTRQGGVGLTIVLATEVRAALL